MTKPLASSWTVVRHRVSLAGRAALPAEAPVKDCAIRLTPVATSPAGEPAPTAAGPLNREYRTGIAADGLYYFLDLPPGDFRIAKLGAQDDVVGVWTVTIPSSAAGVTAAVIVRDLVEPVAMPGTKI